MSKLDILLTKKKRHIRMNCRANNYLNARDELPGGKHPLKTKEEKRTVYEYPVKVVCDPLLIGGFSPGSTFSILEYEAMLQRNAFTIGTTLLIGRALRFVQSDDNGRQCVKKFKSTSTSA